MADSKGVSIEEVVAEGNTFNGLVFCNKSNLVRYVNQLTCHDHRKTTRGPMHPGSGNVGAETLQTWKKFTFSLLKKTLFLFFHSHSSIKLFDVQYNNYGSIQRLWQHINLGL